ncbi:NAD(P)/FAD-dependent oxidoreductase [Nocardioides sp. SYSU D00065]|uniref:flavin-containing monooxygenase n=1 Tax=Nocardioides sp. SYSU D00065 TaxID=2817378 RepID=UPI001B33A4FB|nr:NAD(P)/FAD-dependent oxidoreductase [Nocardioides sp. SYSU D00065]
MSKADHVDVLIIGAGLSGIGAAAHLVKDLPGTTYAVLERRDASGGTWDLFRYPGVRSDSDMHTLGYRFRPWRGHTSLADGASILAYVRDTAREYGVDDHIRYGHHVTAASWDAATARWSVTARVGEETVTVTADFLWACSGYYDYDRGHTPHFEGQERFRGEVVHPQHWPQDLDHAGKRVVVIGSGATAVTLVPALAASGAAHVTMLQRSPTYVLSVPGQDGLKRRLTSLVGERTSYAVTRWKNIAVQSALYKLSRRRPDLVRTVVRKANVALLPPGYAVDTHFNPTYDPWDQRLCLVPDGDLFRAIRAGSATVVTDRIVTFTETGLELASGDRLEADVVVTATGLELQVFGGAELSVDGEVVEPRETMAYRAMMLSGVPNFAFTIGYTNASWTLKADLVAEYVVRVLARMRATGSRSVVPVRDPAVKEVPLLDFESGYVQRALHALPRQGAVAPWQLKQSYVHDALALRTARLDDGVLRWS